MYRKFKNRFQLNPISAAIFYSGNSAGIFIVGDAIAATEGLCEVNPVWDTEDRREGEIAGSTDL